MTKKGTNLYGSSKSKVRTIDDSQSLSVESLSEAANENRLQVVWIDYLRVIAAFSVVLLHVSSDVMGGAPDLSSLQWWVCNITNSLVIWCLPMFVMISGLLLLDPSKEYTLASFYETRIKRLLIPIVFWSLFYLLLVATTSYINNEPVSLWSLIKSVLEGVPYYHLWYMYMIPSLLLFTPYIRKIVGTMSNRHIGFLCIILFLYAIIANAADKFHFQSYSNYSLGNTLFLNWFLLYLGYYIAGYLLGSLRTEIRSLLLGSLFIIAIIATTAGRYFFAERYGLDVGSYFYNYLSLNVVVMSLSFLLIVKSLRNILSPNKLVNWLSSYMLGVYLIHPFFIELFKHAGIRADDFNPVFSIPLVSILVFVTCILLIVLINRIPYIRRVV